MQWVYVSSGELNADRCLYIPEPILGDGLSAGKAQRFVGVKSMEARILIDHIYFTSMSVFG